MFSIYAYEICNEDGAVYQDVFVADTFEDADAIVMECMWELAIEMDAHVNVESLGNDVWRMTITFADTVWKRIIVAPMAGNHSFVKTEMDEYDEF